MDSFVNVCIISAFVILIVILIVVGLASNRSTSKKNIYPVVSNCPDYWYDSYDPTDPTKTKAGTCFNNMNLGKPECGKTVDFSNMDFCTKQTWAKRCDIMWDGITNAAHKCPVEYDFTGQWSAGTFTYGPNNTAVFNWFPEANRKNPVIGVRSGVNTWEFDFTDADKLTGVMLSQNRIDWGGNNIWDRATVAAVKDFALGQSTKCSQGELKSQTAVYRYMGNNTLSHYPNPGIAHSWDPTWATSWKEIDCTGLRKGPAMTFKPAPAGYDLSTKSDSGGNDIIHLENKTVDELASACTRDDKCLGFNDQGWLKHTLHAFTNVPNLNFYTKKGSVITPAPTYENLSTPWNDAGGGNTLYLDRHDIKCNANGALSRLHLQTAPHLANTLRYDYTCMSSGSLGNTLSKTTPFNDDGGGNAVYLDRHDVDCGNNAVITDLKLQRNSSGNQYQYQYKCAAPSKQPLKCRADSTPWNDEGGGNTVYLDRHNIKCKPSEALSRVHLQRQWNAQGNPTGKYRYDYTCCSYD